MLCRVIDVGWAVDVLATTLLLTGCDAHGCCPTLVPCA